MVALFSHAFSICTLVLGLALEKSSTFPTEYYYWERVTGTCVRTEEPCSIESRAWFLLQQNVSICTVRMLGCVVVYVKGCRLPALATLRINGRTKFRVVYRILVNEKLGTNV